MSLKTLNLGSKLAPALASGHPWIYRNHLPNHSLKTGDWVRLEAGKESAIGLYDAEGAIGVKLFSKAAVPDKAWLQTRVKEALLLRKLIPKDTTAYRLLYGEGDGLPGIVADLYERFVVVKSYSQSVEGLLPDIAKGLAKELRLKGIVWRQGKTLNALWGELPPPELIIKENGLSFIANLYEGQKTGLFLDQRENRQTLRQLSRNKSVLNLFSYNGGFSVYALAGGANGVTSVDIAPAATKDAERNAVLNDVGAEHKSVTADVFEYLQSCVSEKRRFDIVILDPPTLAKDKRSKHAALRAYKKLNSLALRCVKPEGLLVSSSCTAQVSESEFKAMLAEAFKDTSLLGQVIHEAGHALDHPVRPNFPEGRYLKFVVARVLEPV